MESQDIPEEVQAEILGDQIEEFYLLQANEVAVRAFTVVQSQLQFVDVYHWIGFDYTGVKNGLEMAGLALEPADFEKLRILESEACKKLNEQLRK